MDTFGSKQPCHKEAVTVLGNLHSAGWQCGPEEISPFGHGNTQFPVPQHSNSADFSGDITRVWKPEGVNRPLVTPTTSHFMKRTSPRWLQTSRN
jgi:hypothetical protein